MLKVFFIASLTLAIAFSQSSGETENGLNKNLQSNYFPYLIYFYSSEYQIILRTKPENCREYEEIKIIKLATGAKAQLPEPAVPGLFPSTIQTRIPVIDWVLQLVSNITAPSTTTTASPGRLEAPIDPVDLPLDF